MTGTRYTDGKKTVDIWMRCWEGTSYGQDFAAEFFDCPGVEYPDDAEEGWHVGDVDYLVEQCVNFLDGKGDFYYEQADEDVYIDVYCIDGELDADTIAYANNAVNRDRLCIII